MLQAHISRESSMRPSSQPVHTLSDQGIRTHLFSTPFELLHCKSKRSMMKGNDAMLSSTAEANGRAHRFRTGKGRWWHAFGTVGMLCRRKLFTGWGVAAIRINESDCHLVLLPSSLPRFVFQTRPSEDIRKDLSMKVPFLSLCQGGAIASESTAQHWNRFLSGYWSDMVRSPRKSKRPSPMCL